MLISSISSSGPSDSLPITSISALWSFPFVNFPNYPHSVLLFTLSAPLPLLAYTPLSPFYHSCKVMERIPRSFSALLGFRLLRLTTVISGFLLFFSSLFVFRFFSSFRIAFWLFSVHSGGFCSRRWMIAAGWALIVFNQVCDLIGLCFLFGLFLYVCVWSVIVLINGLV